MDYFYTAYGLRIRVDFPIPELVPSNSEFEQEPYDVYIRKVDGSNDIARSDERLYWSGIGTYWVRDGREILIRQAPNAQEAAVRLILLGSVFGALLHQRAYVTLHASGVALPSIDHTMVAVGFMGDSRQGKSTMVAAFHAQGHRVVADDLIAIPPTSLPNATVHNERVPVAMYPGFPTIKLWPDATAELFGVPEDIQAAPFASYTPRRVRDVRSTFSAEHLPLKRLYVLTDGPTLKIERLSRPFAVQYLLRHAYWTPELARDEKEVLLQQCIILSHHVDVCHLVRPRILALLPEVVKHVAADVEAIS